MNILITNIYSYKNKGDAVIVISAIRGLKKRFPEANFILSSNDLLDNGKYGPCKVIPSFDRIFHNKLKTDFLNNLLSLANCFFLLLVYNVERVLYNLNTSISSLLPRTLSAKIVSYKEADIIFAVGGGYLLSNSKLRKLDKLIGRVSLHILCLEFYFGKAYKKEIVLLHQSIGPFNNIGDKKLVIKYLKDVDLIVVREEYSYELLRQSKIFRITLKPDLAFSFEDNGNSWFNRNENKSNQIKIGITAKQCLEAAQQSKYETELAGFISYFLKNNPSTTFYFMPQVIYSEGGDDDTLVANRIFNMLAKNDQERCFVIQEDLTPADLKSTIAECKFFIGTRMHSNIFALCSLVKTVAIAYEYKTSGIMAMLDLSEYTTTASRLTKDFLQHALEKIEVDGDYKDRLKIKIDNLKRETWDFEIPCSI